MAFLEILLYFDVFGDLEGSERVLIDGEIGTKQFGVKRYELFWFDNVVVAKIGGYQDE